MARKLKGAEKEAFLRKMAAGRRKAAKGGAKAKPRKNSSSKPRTSKPKTSKRASAKSSAKSSCLGKRVTRLETTVAKHGRAISDIGGVQEFMFSEMQKGGFFGGGRQARDTIVSPPRRNGASVSAFN